jgi:hypothetical protein
MQKLGVRLNCIKYVGAISTIIALNNGTLIKVSSTKQNCIFLFIPKDIFK